MMSPFRGAQLSLSVLGCLECLGLLIALWVAPLDHLDQLSFSDYNMSSEKKEQRKKNKVKCLRHYLQTSSTNPKIDKQKECIPLRSILFFLVLHKNYC